MSRSLQAWCMVVLLASGCSRCGPGGGEDAGQPNNNQPDASSGTDAGGRNDGGGGGDAGRRDAGLTDAATTDAARSDASQSDAASTDAAQSDAGAADAAQVDGGNGDAGQVDAGSADAGPCVPFCVGRECGDNGCGGSCGQCTSLAAPFCDDTLGQCMATCTPRCAGKNCGDNGCGGSCGTCVGSLQCTTQGVCAPSAWTCDPIRYAARDQCDCGCGAPDPDCTDTTLPIAGCSATERCASDGRCSPRAPSGWTCLASQYSARDACDCGCGVVDPDCSIAGLPVRGCSGRNATCSTSATCACTPNCGDNVCGDDGCGGSCGTCSDPNRNICLGGACVSACNPEPIRCNFAACGSDACGGSCGTCEPGTNCVDGRCLVVAVSDPLSCFGRCGNLNPAGCSCSPDCVALGSCCPDYDTTCGNCLPNCGTRECGPDGCGGTCGLCNDADGGTDAVCSAGVCITGCQPSCAGKQCGDDGCGGQCGSCEAGESCEWTGQCVPDTWFCDSSLYADGTACHCGCGAVDPNCQQSTIVFGCVSGSSTCSTQGICSDTTCSSDTECGLGRICAGTYYQGDARFRGTCTASVGGNEVGEFCTFGGNCATGVCAGGVCRQQCGADGDCPSDQLCVAMPLRTLAGEIEGFVNVCELLPGRFGTCAAQADCPQQACVAFLDPDMLEPQYTCANSPRTVGTSCSSAECPVGQHCARVGNNDVCTISCPGGNADCPIGWHCGSVTLSSPRFTSPTNAPTIPICIAN